MNRFVMYFVSLVAMMAAITITTSSAVAYDCEELVPCPADSSAGDANNDLDAAKKRLERIEEVKAAKAAEEAAKAPPKIEVLIKVEEVFDTSSYSIFPIVRLEGSLFTMTDVFPFQFFGTGGVEFPIYEGLYVDALASAGLWYVPEHTATSTNTIVDIQTGNEQTFERTKDYAGNTGWLFGLGTKLGWRFGWGKLAATTTWFVMDYETGPLLQGHLGGELSLAVSQYANISFAGEIPVLTTVEKDDLKGFVARVALELSWEKRLW